MFSNLGEWVSTNFSAELKKYDTFAIANFQFVSKCGTEVSLKKTEVSIGGSEVSFWFLGKTEFSFSAFFEDRSVFFPLKIVNNTITWVPIQDFFSKKI